MSTTSKVVLALSCSVTAGIIAYVQYTQVKERHDRRIVVEQELKASEERRRLNIIELKEQQTLAQRLRQIEEEQQMRQ